MNNNKHLASLIFAALNKREFSDVQPFLSDDIVLNFPGVGDVSGTKRVLVFMKSLLRKFPELNFIVGDVISEGEKVVVIWTNTGKKITGEDYTNSGNTLFHFSEGKIMLISDYFKDTSFTLDK